MDGEGVPFRLVLLEDFPLGMVADHFDIDEAAQIELLCSELRHCSWGEVDGGSLTKRRIEVEVELDLLSQIFRPHIEHQVPKNLIKNDQASPTHFIYGEMNAPNTGKRLLSSILRLPPAQRIRTFSILNRPPPNYPGHVPLTLLERGALAVGSAFGSLRNPYRHDLIASLGEATAKPYFISRLHRAMLASPTGRRILRDKPRITSKTMRLEELREMGENTVGRAYANWLDREGVTPDTRDPVRFIDDPEEAYVMQRYRETHDFTHAITGLPVIIEGELAVKAFEFANTLLPMTALSLVAVVRLKPVERQRFWDVYLPWALRNGLQAEEVINVYWEEELETDVDVLRRRLGIERPPDLREIRRTEREKRKKMDV